MKTRHLFTHDVRPGHLYRIPAVPDNVMLDLTWACDHRCVFCYNPAESSRRGHPPTATTEAILRVLAEWGVREVLYLGGEPTLHPGFDGIIDLGAALGLEQRVVTNGGRIDRQRARRLAEKRVEVGVSLHGSEAAIHDRLTKAPGSFERALRVLDELVAADAGVFVQYSPTRLDNGGLPKLAKMIGRRWDSAIRFIDVNRLLPYGEGGGSGRNVVVDEDGWWDVLRDAGRLGGDGWRVWVESVPRCWIRDRSEADSLDTDELEAILSTLRPCYMGVNQLAFDPKGHVKLCPGGPPLGPSILEGDPRRLWKEHALLVKRRELRFLPVECVDYERRQLCDEFYECGGGCRSAAGALPGAADPLGP